MTFETFISYAAWYIPIVVAVILLFVWVRHSDDRKRIPEEWWKKPAPTPEEFYEAERVRHLTEGQGKIFDPSETQPVFRTIDEMADLPIAQRPYRQEHTIPLDEAVRKAENPVVERPFQYPPEQPNHPHPHVNLPGKATHWMPNDSKLSACGLVGPFIRTTNPRKTDCNNCRRTWEWKNRIKETENQRG